VELVVGPVEREPLIEAAGRDIAGGGGDRSQRAQHAARHEPAEPDRDDRHHPEREQGGDEKLVELVRGLVPGDSEDAPELALDLTSLHLDVRESLLGRLDRPDGGGVQARTGWHDHELPRRPGTTEHERRRHTPADEADIGRGGRVPHHQVGDGEEDAAGDEKQSPVEERELEPHGPARRADPGPETRQHGQIRYPA
jgi:hypothetical protein